MVSDPIADLLTRIRNALAVKKPEVSMPYSQEKEALAKILVKEGFLTRIKDPASAKASTSVKTPAFAKATAGKSADKTAGKQNQRELICVLKYDQGKPAILALKRISKPGLRVYKSYSDLPRRSAYVTTIISTSKGLRTDKQAKKEKIGGEVICRIW